MTLTRRSLLASMAAALASPAFASQAPLIQVVKDPNCGCCTAWIEILARDGFRTEVHDVSYQALSTFKARSGISEQMASCHTAHVDGYVIEGHVPPADIRRLLSERPEAIGLSVPGMPWGSPGMGPESEREAYDVYLILKDSSTEVFQHYPAAT